WVVWNLSHGTLIVARSESSQIRLYEVPATGGPERTIPLDRSSPLFSLFVSPGTIRSDGQMLVSLNVPDSWFNPLAQLDLQSGQITRLAGDGVSDLQSGAWTPMVASSPAARLWSRRSGGSLRMTSNLGVTSA